MVKSIYRYHSAKSSFWYSVQSIQLSSIIQLNADFFKIPAIEVWTQ